MVLKMMDTIIYHITYSTKTARKVLAHVFELYQSDDNVTQVVTVRTKDGVSTRPAAKLGLLEAYNRSKIVS